MTFAESTVGRKLLMAVTGIVMIGFVIVHLLGNLSVYAGPDAINTYSAALHRLGPVVWAFRLVLLAVLVVHVFFGVQLTLENRAAKPEPYAVKKSLQTTFAARNMIWTGLLIAAFIAYHLLHFTFQVTNPGTSALRHPDGLGRPDVFMMVVSGFRNAFISSAYVFAMGMLGLHLSHSIQSLFQTLGLNSARTFPVLEKGGNVAALLLALGFVSIPIVIVMGLLK
ncbi:MAG TPA: succinate dehydrogenase cytochrome b subunit [Thermodesulfovibrionales bacterium]|nr:succinate dehydrogenase cytochrome b subunit [Thermodesulfovibrionales bacterium]